MRKSRPWGAHTCEAQVTPLVSRTLLTIGGLEGLLQTSCLPGPNVVEMPPRVDSTSKLTAISLPCVFTALAYSASTAR